jgi:hypothetical protein
MDVCEHLIIKVPSTSISTDRECLEKSDKSSEHDHLDDDNSADSDDDVEEANRNNDIVKTIEGLW